MRQLIPTTDHQGTQMVDARLLHSKLQSGYQFADWIKERIQKYKFKEDPATTALF